MSGRTLIRDAEVDGSLVDVLLDGGRVAMVGTGRRPSAADQVIDAAGGALLPGLHDHHVHLLAMAARLGGVDLDPCDTPAAADAAITAAAAVASTADESEGGWVRVAGYDEHRHGPLDLERLDRLCGPCAVRVQHRTGLSWLLSTFAQREVGLDDAPPSIVERDRTGGPTGWVHRGDDWLGERIGHRDQSLAAVSRALAAVGITGVTDATAELGAGRLAQLERARGSGELVQHVTLLGVDEPAAGFGSGPRKLLVDEQLGLDPDALAGRIAAVHRTHRSVALHAVTRAENITAVTAILAAGPRPGDRIEHGAIMPFELDAQLAAAGITVIIQPALVGERGDHHLAVVDPDDLALLHRQASFLAAGVRLAAGSDAPVTSVDPWRAIATAVSRRTRSGASVGPAERVDARTALGWYLTDPTDPGGALRRVEPGAPADLCLLDVPLGEMLAAPDAAHVHATWIDGVMVRP